MNAMSIGNAAVFMKNITAMMIREYDTPEIILVFICFILSNVEKHFVSNQHFICLSRHDVGIVPYEPNVNLILANVALPRAKNRLWSFPSE